MAHFMVGNHFAFVWIEQAASFFDSSHYALYRHSKII